MLRASLALLGLAITLASPALAAGDTRYVLIVDAPWQADQTIAAGRDAGGLLVSSGWHSALFYFPEGVAMPGQPSGASISGAMVFPIQRPDPVCNPVKQTESP